MSFVARCLRFLLYLLLAAAAVPATAQAADGYLGCWAHQSDKNRVLWTRPFAANQSEKAATSADFLSFLESKSYVQDLSSVSGTCIWKRDAAEVTQEINSRKAAFRNATDLGVSYQGPSSQPSSAAPAAAFKDDCDKGNAAACRNYGYALETGTQGVARDESRAASYYRDGCNRGDAIACRNMAILLAEGRGVAVDHATARQFYAKACAGGEALSCYNLGVAHATGSGGPTDVAQAITLYKKACDLKFADGCNNLGWHYDTGTGVPVDKAKSLVLYGQACDLGNALGCNNRDLTRKARAAPGDFDQKLAPILANLDRAIGYAAKADADFARGDADGAMGGYYAALIILPDLVLSPLRDLTAANLAATEKRPEEAQRVDTLVNQSLALSDSLQAKLKKTCLTWPNNFKGLPYSGVCEHLTK